MAPCLGFSLTFPCLDLPECGKCVKKGLTPSATERASLDKVPQCAGCGIVYAYLSTVLCGACIKYSEAEPLAFDGLSQVTKFLADRANTFQAEATQYRLNQHSPNKALQAAALVKQKISALKKQCGTENITVFVSIWSYPEHKKGAGSKAQLPVINGQYATTASVDYVFEELLKKAAAIYQKSPVYKHMVTVFDRESVIFTVQNGTSTHQIEEEFILRPVGEFFGHIKTRKMLSDKDAKAHTLTLCLYVYEKTELSSEDDTSIPLPLPKSIRRGSTTPKKASKRSSHAAFGENISPVSASMAPPLKKKVTISRTRSAARIPYRSSYRREIGPSLTYDAYDFTQTLCNVDPISGVVSLVQSNSIKSILVGQGWQSHIKEGKPAGAYISKGFSKYAFKGLLDSKYYALFQCQPMRTLPTNNRSDLLDELKLLGMAQFFLGSFYARAKAAGLGNMPVIRWNFTGAFVGHAKNITPPPDDKEDTRSLIFEDFLVTPLLQIDKDTEERKFSGNDDFRSNTDTLGRFIDAYVHHVVCDSFEDILFADIQGIISKDGSLCLFDPQADTHHGNSGHWDLGKPQIKLYLEKHNCNHICRTLELNLPIQNRDSDDAFPQRVSVALGSTKRHPLRVGFD
ncbi:hypothetical protein BDZ94DRAFT_1310227 [Collybia nuda]|uniref:Alpha-type protein kinase domain-containing protein n=1 Tax=Collybia nuda TaxID=64659 RepID=A0A9P5Y593_9AGAR|nr:hypothetical protein BDZ94DRAFT_1310227 [Collybia nuda]